MNSDGAKPAKAGRSAAIFAAVVLVAIALIAVFDADNWFLWVKAVHVLAVLSWMVGLLYLPRRLLRRGKGQDLRLFILVVISLIGGGAWLGSRGGS